MAAEPKEHLSLDNGPHPTEWRDGATCDECQHYMSIVRSKHGNVGVNFNIGRLKADNAGHYTQREVHRAAVDAAKAEGREIQKYQGSRTQRSRGYDDVHVAGI